MARGNPAAQNIKNQRAGRRTVKPKPKPPAPSPVCWELVVPASGYLGRYLFPTDALVTDLQILCETEPKEGSWVQFHSEREDESSADSP